MSKRSALFVPVALLGVMIIASAPAAAGGTTGCPAGTVAASAFASANLGAKASTCGSVSAGASSVTTSIPTGAPGITVESWLGITLGLPGFSGQSASVLQFSNFSASQGASINFNWIASFEPGTEGYAFALLDGQRTVLQEQTNLPVIQAGGGLNIIALHNNTLTLGAGGTHTVSFGIVEACSACLLGINAAPLDPAATFSSIILTDSTATPEPATLSLMGLGLAGVFADIARRKRL